LHVLLQLQEYRQLRRRMPLWQQQRVPLRLPQRVRKLGDKVEIQRGVLRQLTAQGRHRQRIGGYRRYRLGRVRIAPLLGEPEQVLRVEESGDMLAAAWRGLVGF
jgi:hypothetical protein